MLDSVRNSLQAKFLPHVFKEGRDLQPQLLEDGMSVFKGVSDNSDLLFVVKELSNERRDSLHQRTRAVRGPCRLKD